HAFHRACVGFIKFQPLQPRCEGLSLDVTSGGKPNIQSAPKNTMVFCLNLGVPDEIETGHDSIEQDCSAGAIQRSVIRLNTIGCHYFESVAQQRHRGRSFILSLWPAVAGTAIGVSRRGPCSATPATVVRRTSLLRRYSGFQRNRPLHSSQGSCPPPRP